MVINILALPPRRTGRAIAQFYQVFTLTRISVHKQTFIIAILESSGLFKRKLIIEIRVSSRIRIARSLQLIAHRFS